MKGVDFNVLESEVTLNALLMKYILCQLAGMVAEDKALRDASSEAEKKLDEFSVEMAMRKDIFDNIVAFRQVNEIWLTITNPYVRLLAGWLVCHNIPKKGVKLYFHAPFGALNYLSILQ